MSGISRWDLYRRIPHDLTASTTQGGLISLLCITVMVILVSMEVWHYLSPPIIHSLSVDENTEAKIRVQFDITLLDLPCKYASVDVKDRLGVNRINVEQNIKKQVYNPGEPLYTADEAPQVAPGSSHPEEEDMEAAMASDHSSPHITSLKEFTTILKDSQYVIVDFYAPWCIWCARLAPTWEKFGRLMHEQHFHTVVRKVDCVALPDLCSQQRIRAYPTMRLFKEGKGLTDYDGMREAKAMLKWSSDITNEHPDTQQEMAIDHQKSKTQGCRVSGFILVNRVPGNFHLQALSSVHSIIPKETNLSHVIHHLSFGEELESSQAASLPKEMKRWISPLNGKFFITGDRYITFEHFLKIMTASYDLRPGRDPIRGYQIHYSNYQHFFEEEHADDDDGKVPEARFSYDFSPAALVFSYGGRRWYEFITNLCAIVGGVFTVLGLFDRGLHGVRSKVFKDNAGKLG